MPNKKQYHGTDMNGYKLTGLPKPTLEDTTDAATVQFVLDNAGGAPLATNVQFTPLANTFPEGTDNVDEALKHLFTSANSGKTALATAIGTPITSSNTFGEMATAIGSAKTALDTFIDSAEGTTTGNETLAQLTDKLDDVRVFQTRGKLNKASGSTTVIPLKSKPTLDKLCHLVYVRTGESSSTHFTADFNNGDKDNFMTNDFVEFVGTTNTVAKIKTEWSSPYTSVSGLTGVSEATLNLSVFQNTGFSLLSITPTQINYRAFPPSQVLKPTGSIDLTGVTAIETINITRGTSQYPVGISVTAQNFIAFSFDEGATWYGSNSINTPIQINDINDTTEFASKGFWRWADSNWTYELLNTLREMSVTTSNKLRIAYLMQSSPTSCTQLDQLQLSVLLNGSFVPMGTSGTPTAPTISYNATSGDLSVTFNATDSYIINYFDKP